MRHQPMPQEMFQGCRFSLKEDGYLEAGVTHGAPVSLEVALPSQEPVACAAGEAVGVVLLPHRLHHRLPGPQRFVAEGTDVCKKQEERFGAVCLSFPKWG